MLPRLEGRSIAVGAGLTIALAVPPTLVAVLASDDDSLAGTSWVPLLFLWIVIAFFAGGVVAARAQPHAPLAHGALAALFAYVLVQGVGVLRHVLSGDDVSWLSIPFNALLATSTGMAGGIVANWWRARRSTP
jgi:putative membrane protein (TIGR04086 family)